MIDNRARYREIQNHVYNKDVLDIGIVQHDMENVGTDYWLHSRLVDDAANAIGIDILQREVEKIQELGYDVRHADAEDFDIDQRFDVIVAGELIEHLSNVGQFLDCCHDHLRNNGELILTTPNGMSIVNIAERLVKYEVWNSEHTCIFDEQTLEQVLARHNFELIETTYIKTNLLEDLLSKQLLYEVLERMPPNRISNKTLMIVAKPMNSGRNIGT